VTELDASRCYLGDAGLRPLLAALPRNAHLRALCIVGSGMSAACGRGALLAAVRANGSLRTLNADFGGAAAEALVRGRSAHAQDGSGAGGAGGAPRRRG
jgi:hypothetical protein